MWLWAISKQSLLIEAERLLIRDLRTIPTHVGRTAIAKPLVIQTADHPHARGENAVSVRYSGMSFGPSPRTWGELSMAMRARGYRRTIPTHVGRTPNVYGTLILPTDHPHARGEN